MDKEEPRLRFMRRLLPAILLALTSTAIGVEGAWLTDFDKAREKARKENKYLLVDFTGSDWCGWCIRLKKEVFGEKAFQEQASKDFVLVSLDFPKKPENIQKVPLEQQRRNQELVQQYNVTGFPTILLMDAEGRPFATTGYQPGGVEAYLKHIGKLRDNQRKVEELLKKGEQEDLPAAERARALHQALELSPSTAMDAQYRATIQKIIELDADNALGLRNVYLYRLRLLDVDQAFTERDYDKATSLMQAILTELKPQGEQLQEAHYILSVIYQMTGNADAMILHLRAGLAVQTQGYIQMVLQQQSAPFLIAGGYAIGSLPGYYGHPYMLTADGDENTYFWSGRPLRDGDTVRLVLDEPRAATNIRVSTGRPGKTDALLHSGVLEISTDGQTYTQVASFEGGKAQAKLEKETAVKSIRIRATADQTDWLALREITIN